MTCARAGWAPEMHRVGGEFRVYFAARDKHTRELCIGVGRSSSAHSHSGTPTKKRLRSIIKEPKE